VNITNNKKNEIGQCVTSYTVTDVTLSVIFCIAYVTVVYNGFCYGGEKNSLQTCVVWDNVC